MDELFRQTVYLRMGERVALTAIIVIMALIVTVGFWKSVQRVEFRADKSVGLGGNFVLATPVFALLALVGYAWVTLNAPVSFAPSAPSTETAAPQTAEVASNASAGRFIASVENEMAFRQVQILHQISGINCLRNQALRSGPIPPDQEDAVASAKLELLEPVWDPDWGDFFALNDWAMGFTDEKPKGDGVVYFEDTLPGC